MAKILNPPPKTEVKGEHIFPDTELHQLAIRWNELNAKKRHTEAMVLLERIIEGSTPMFERLALHEHFHHTVSIDVLVSAAQGKVVNWLLKWKPERGKLFTWFSKCAKHAFLSELVKVNQWRKRYHSTDDSLEKFLGAEDHEVDKHDLAIEVRREIEDLTCRWGDPQELGALRFLIECIIDEDNRDRQAAIRGAAYAYGLSLDMSKFFYRWALTALRSAFCKRVRLDFSEQDLFLLSESYTDFADLLDIMPYETLKKVMLMHGGKRLKIPPISLLIRLKEAHQVYQAIEATDKDPVAISEVAAQHNKTVKSATQAYEEMCEKLNPTRAGEFYIFKSNELHE